MAVSARSPGARGAASKNEMHDVAFCAKGEDMEMVDLSGNNVLLRKAPVHRLVLQLDRVGPDGARIEKTIQLSKLREVAADPGKRIFYFRYLHDGHMNQVWLQQRGDAAEFEAFVDRAAARLKKVCPSLQLMNGDLQDFDSIAALHSNDEREILPHTDAARLVPWLAKTGISSVSPSPTRVYGSAKRRRVLKPAKPLPVLVASPMLGAKRVRPLVVQPAPTTPQRNNDDKIPKMFSAAANLAPAPPPAPGGFRNTGNSCYVNALLQVLVRIDALVKTIESHDNLSASDAAKRFVKVVSFRASVDKKPDVAAVFNPSDIKQDVGFANGHQQDVHEFFVLLLDTWERQLRSRALSSLFESKVSYNLSCAHCAHSRTTQTEAFSHLSLDLPDQPTTVDTLLDHYFGVTDLDDYKCDACGQRGAQRTTQPESLAKVLVLQLKRFGHTGAKRQARVSLQESLKLAGNIFQLHGVVFHRGSTIHFGHYVAATSSRFSKADSDGDDNSWTMFNDETVRRGLEPSAFLASKRSERDAYLLFYIA
ncbi:Ubiquitin carboxyl-terminal hydrolase 17-like protein C (Deubiquitinating enzyme 2) [Durusdinium trenchii]|uniref:Ubiquitin carboxyl-terminal hydrolase n=1 Tax=Durusdinium trenchii TaxID=1381693 RepID=A0ABP0PS67_9DINO